VRGLSAPLVAFSDEMRQNDRALRSFLFARMYRHYKVNRMTTKARRVVRELFEHYLARPDCLPDEWQQQARDLPEAQRARLVADYIAGMTDRYAQDEHASLFDVPSQERMNLFKYFRDVVVASLSRWRRPGSCRAASTPRASPSSRRATAPTATSRPTPPWCWPSRPA
jgi:hypothetical protein